jgi:hypothetical protein
MGQKHFVGSNILIYAHDPSAGEKRDRARQLIEGLSIALGRDAIFAQAALALETPDCCQMSLRAEADSGADSCEPPPLPRDKQID